MAPQLKLLPSSMCDGACFDNRYKRLTDAANCGKCGIKVRNPCSVPPTHIIAGQPSKKIGMYLPWKRIRVIMMGILRHSDNRSATLFKIREPGGPKVVWPTTEFPSAGRITYIFAGRATGRHQSLSCNSRISSWPFRRDSWSPLSLLHDRTPT
jgi:hypothetical protein